MLQSQFAIDETNISPGIQEDMGNQTSTTNKPNKNNTLRLSDIILIKSPDNEIFNNLLFFIEYIDQKKMVITNVESLSSHKLTIKNGTIGDGSITEINILERNPERGYAKQNSLVPGTWINIYFNGNVPAILTGEITNLEEDMIEITSYPDNETLYIDFGYKGLPEKLNINVIERRSPPKDGELIDQTDVNRDEVVNINIEDDIIDDDDDRYDDMNEQEEDLIETEEQEVLSSRTITEINNNIQGFIIEADERKLGAILEDVTETRNVSNKKQRYDLQSQTDDLLSDLLLKYKEKDRTIHLQNELKKQVEYFVQLRNTFSNIDEYGNILGPKKNGSKWKPLVGSLKHLDHQLYWILPVVKNIHTICSDKDEDIPADITTSTTVVDDLTQVLQYYMKGGNGEAINHYKRYIEELTANMTPSIEANIEDKNVISYINSLENILAVIDNNGNFTSTKMKNGSIGQCRMDKYQFVEPQLLLEPRDVNMNSSTRTVRTPIRTNDIISLSSFITLPFSSHKFSKINLPYTDIHKRCQLSQLYSTYFKTIHRKTKLNRIFIDNFKHSYYKADTNDSFNVYKLNVNNDTLSTLSKSEVLEKYIQSIVPMTKDAIDMVSVHALTCTNYHDFITHLEPFLIYTNDITYKQYEIIRTLVQSNIQSYITKLKNRMSEFNKIRTIPSTNVSSIQSVEDLITMPNSQEVLDKYVRREGIMTSSELLAKIIKSDGGSLLADVLSIQNLDNLIHDNISSIMSSLNDDSPEQVLSENSASNQCKTVVITKQYYFEEDIKKDEGMDVYYDKKYDETDYTMLIKPSEPHTNIFEKFTSEHSKMSQDEFFEFIKKKVSGVLPNGSTDIDYLTETLITGKKRVREGDYALYYSSVDDQNVYLKRVNNKWKIDKTIDDKINSTNKKNDCDLKLDCVSVNDDCVPKDMNKTKLRKSIVQKLISEFDNQYEKSKEQLASYVTNKYAKDMYFLEKIVKYRSSEVLKYDTYQFKLGLTVESYDEIIKSPFRDTLKTIMAKENLTQKYTDLLYFISNFTEEYTSQETDDESFSPSHWRYCIETKKPLVPIFLYHLATAWVDDGDDYDKSTFRTVLDRVVRESGVESDDGGYWVDKHSGFEICKKMFDDDEGYETSGRKAVSRELVTEDTKAKYARELKKMSDVKKTYNTPQTKAMFGIINTLVNAMSISLDNTVDFIITLASSILHQPGVLSSEKEYKEFVKESAVRGKKVPPYEYVYSETILYLTLGAFLIGIQTKIPGVVSKKTYPGCIRSFNGYPLEGKENLGGITYLICIVSKIPTSSGVWKVLRKKNFDSILKKTKAFIDTYYINNSTVQEKINEKLEYTLTHPQEEIQEENRINNWTMFLPPLFPIKMKNIENVADGYRKLLISDIKMGSPIQWKKINVLKGKMFHYSLLIQEIIQTIIDNKVSRENTNLSKELFLESSIRGEMKFFEGFDSEITRTLPVITAIENVLNDINKLSIASTIYCDVDSKAIQLPLKKEFSEETIYRTFISLCKFDRDGITDDNIIAICGDKPESFDNSDPISEKIRKLKQQGNVYDSDHFQKLLEVIGSKNKIQVHYESTSKLQSEILVDYFEQIDYISSKKYDDESDENNENSIGLSSDITELRKKHIDTFVSLKKHFELVIEDFENNDGNKTKEVRSLRNLLTSENNKMKQTIISEFENTLSLDRNSIQSLKLFFNTVTKWKFTEDTTSKDTNDQFHNCLDFIKTYVHNISTVFPHMIRRSKEDHHKEVWSDSKEAIKRMGLSPLLVENINESNYSYYTELVSFYNTPVMNKVLDSISEYSEILLNLVDNTPYYSNNVSNTNTNTEDTDIPTYYRDTCLMIFEYYFLLSFQNYIDLVNTDMMLNIDNEEENYTVENLVRREDKDIPDIDPSVYTNDVAELKSNVYKMLIGFTKIIQNHRDLIDVTYLQVADINFKVRESEKHFDFTERLAGLTDEEMEIDTIKKINKLGVWNKGLQKGLKTFVKDDYDRDREFAERLQEVEKVVKRQQKQATEENMQQYIDDYLEELEIEEGINDDEYDLSMYKGDDENGDYGGLEEENWDDME